VYSKNLFLKNEKINIKKTNETKERGEVYKKRQVKIFKIYWENIKKYNYVGLYEQMLFSNAANRKLPASFKIKISI